MLLRDICQSMDGKLREIRRHKLSKLLGEKRYIFARAFQQHRVSAFEIWKEAQLHA